VAVGNYSQWQGVYNHCDSYPTGLGKELWDWVQQAGKTGLGFDSHLKLLLKSKRWEAFVGKREVDESEPLMTSERYNFDIRWIYIIDPQADTLIVSYRNGEGGRDSYAFPLAGPEPDWAELEQWVGKNTTPSTPEPPKTFWDQLNTDEL
jgi:hypothetical protein